MNIINEKVENYIHGLYKPLSNELKAFREEGEKNHVPIILRDTEELILNMLRIKKPKKILEIGTAIGYSACCFATACEEARILTIEQDSDMKVLAEANIRNLGFENRIQIIEGDGLQVMNDMKGWNKEELFDFVFIDAGKSHYQEFFDEARNMCNPNALIISDNVLLKTKTASDPIHTVRRHRTHVRKMREFLSHVTNLSGVHTSVIPVGDGLAISVIEGNENNEKHKIGGINE